MGCASSVSQVCNPQKDKQIVTAFLLTAHQKKLIRDSWKLIQGKRTEVGVKVFLT